LTDNDSNQSTIRKLLSTRRCLGIGSSDNALEGGNPTDAGFFANMTTPASWQPALRAHFLQGHEWVTQGNAPPTSTRLKTTPGGEIARDSNDNALLVEITGASAPRLPFVDLGEAKFITGFLGTFEPQPPPTIE
jgi:hypothetical protein